MTMDVSEREEQVVGLLESYIRSSSEPEITDRQEAKRIPSTWNYDNLIRKRDDTYEWVLQNGVRFVFFLLPSFIIPEKYSQPASKSHPATDWLDGLRGYCALFVVFGHYLISVDLNQLNGPNPNSRSILDWFPFRVLWSATAAVAIFFLVSGYALSYQALKVIREGDSSKLLNSLASSTFRRAFRLYIPMNISSFITMLFAYLGWYREGPVIIEQPHKSTFWLHVQSWFSEVMILSDPLRPLTAGDIYKPKYDPQTWTIYVEMKGSLIIFILLLGTSRLKASVRMIVFTGFIFCYTYIQQYQIVLFIGGIFIAELGLIHSSSKNRSITLDVEPMSLKPCSYRQWLHMARNVCLTVIFVVACFCLSIPPGQDYAYKHGYGILYNLVPMVDEDKFVWSWLTMGSFGCVLSLQFAPFLQRIFTTRFAQFLGKISYSMYLMHVKLIFSLGVRMLPMFFAVTGEETLVGRILSHVMGGGTLLFVIFWMSDVYTRSVDEKSVAFARWLVQKCSVV